MYLCNPNEFFRTLGRLDTYIIDLKGIENDSCQYDFLLDDSFFADLEATEVQKGNVKAHLGIKKLASSFELSFTIEGKVVVSCDRCLDDMWQPISSTDRLYVKFGPEYLDEGEDLVVVPEDEGTINVAWFFYEFIVLAIPLRHVHADGECNSEMMQKLNEHLSADSDGMDERTNESGHKVDPRWDGLKNLLDNN